MFFDDKKETGLRFVPFNEGVCDISFLRKSGLISKEELTVLSKAFPYTIQVTDSEHLKSYIYEKQKDGYFKYLYPEEDFRWIEKCAFAESLYRSYRMIKNFSDRSEGFDACCFWVLLDSLTDARWVVAEDMFSLGADMISKTLAGLNKKQATTRYRQEKEDAIGRMKELQKSAFFDLAGIPEYYAMDALRDVYACMEMEKDKYRFNCLKKVFVCMSKQFDLSRPTMKENDVFRSAKLLWETANKANVYNPYFSDEDKIELFDKMDSVKGFFHKEKPTPVVQAMKSSLVCFGYENGQNERS